MFKNKIKFLCCSVQTWINTGNENTVVCFILKKKKRERIIWHFAIKSAKQQLAIYRHHYCCMWKNGEMLSHYILMVLAYHNTLTGSTDVSGFKSTSQLRLFCVEFACSVLPFESRDSLHCIKITNYVIDLQKISVLMWKARRFMCPILLRSWGW